MDPAAQCHDSRRSPGRIGGPGFSRGAAGTPGIAESRGTPLAHTLCARLRHIFWQHRDTLFDSGSPISIVGDASHTGGGGSYATSPGGWTCVDVVASVTTAVH